ncbi:MAG: PhnD/SsuA/transferrin family substrate-binding protein [Deltaproteobacteria bacterium]|nr:PhnD/SsuA/transferrin family substrate-binding protein [Deltaproteobacteria bacterium]
MDALAVYLQKKMGPGITIKGRYFNERDPALACLRETPPVWGIIRLGFYAAHAVRFPMTALASTRPGGYDKDIWRLIVGRDGPDNWNALRGKVTGNMLFETDASACLLLNVLPAQLPFSLAGTFRAFRSLRRVIKGRATGVVLDRPQYEAVKALPLAKEIKVIHTSRDLPTSPVVWFGTPDDKAKRLTSILLGMKADSDAENLLKLLQTDGFEPADRTLPQFTRGKNASVCFP